MPAIRAAYFGYDKGHEHAMLTYMARRVPAKAKKYANSHGLQDGDRGRYYYSHMAPPKKAEVRHHAYEIGAWSPTGKKTYYLSQGPAKAPTKVIKGKYNRAGGVAYEALYRRSAHVRGAAEAPKRAPSKKLIITAAKAAGKGAQQEATKAGLKGAARLRFYKQRLGEARYAEVKKDAKKKAPAAKAKARVVRGGTGKDKPLSRRQEEFLVGEIIREEKHKMARVLQNEKPLPRRPKAKRQAKPLPAAPAGYTPYWKVPPRYKGRALPLTPEEIEELRRIEYEPEPWEVEGWGEGEGLPHLEPPEVSWGPTRVFPKKKGKEEVVVIEPAPKTRSRRTGGGFNYELVPSALFGGES